MTEKTREEKQEWLAENLSKEVCQMADEILDKFENKPAYLAVKVTLLVATSIIESWAENSEKEIKEIFSDFVQDFNGLLQNNDYKYKLAVIKSDENGE